MKKLLLFVGAILLNVSLLAQIDSVYKYCEVTSDRGSGKDRYKFNMIVDSGQITWEGNQLTSKPISRAYKNKNGEHYLFNSPIGALNFMALKGWECVQIYFNDNNPDGRKFILRKKIPNR